MHDIHGQGDGAPSRDSGTRESPQGPAADGAQPGEGLLAGGQRDRGDHGGRPYAPGFRDEGRTITVIASGPSAGSTTQAQRRRFPAICVNDAWRLHPDAEAIYAADPRWWEIHAESIADTWKGGRLFGSHTCRSEYAFRPGAITGAGTGRARLERRRVVFEPGLSNAPGRTLHAGGPVGNSGAQAIGLAAEANPWRILLLGFDMRPVDGKDHFFGAHPAPLNQVSPYEVFWKGMWSMAAALNERGIEVLNGSPESALPYWRKLSAAELEDLCAPTC